MKLEAFIFTFIASLFIEIVQAHRRIVGGSISSTNPPFLAALVDKPLFYDFFSSIKIICGGFIYSERWVVTAAHCIHPIKSITHVGVGGLNYKKMNKYYKVQQSFFHNRYKSEDNQLKYDIALVRTIDSMDKVNGICINQKTLEDQASLTVYGWGNTQNDKKKGATDTLKELKLTYRKNHQLCSDFAAVIEGYSFCFQGSPFKEGDNHVSFGDSGGPALLDSGGEPECSYTIASTMSIKSGLNSNVLYMVGTNLSKYTDWITFVTTNIDQGLGSNVNEKNDVTVVYS